MSDPVEVMAKAIQEAPFENLVACTWDEMPPDGQNMRLSEARLAIKALDAAGWAVVPKVATLEMLRDGATWGTLYLDGKLGRDFSPLWHDMVEAGRVKP